MDSGLKERLVGAAVLIALGVWLIPWILDGRDEAPALVERADESVELPALDEPARTQTRTIALNESQRPDEPVDTPAALPSAAPIADPTELPPPETPAVTSPPPEAAVAAQAEPADPAPAARAEPVEPVPAVEAQPAAADGDWYVQLGSFSDAANAKRLASRVEPFGFDAEVSTYRSGGRTLNRVRVGPSKTREAAEVIASSLAAHGFVAQVVTSD